MKRTPLARGTKGLTRRVGVNPKSARKAATDAVLAESRLIVRRRSGGRCEIRSDVCTGTAQDHPHHRLERSQGGNQHRPFLLADVCPECHHYIHDHPALSYERGWLLHNWQVSDEA